MTERVRDTGDELVFYDDQRTLLCVSGPTRLLGAAHGGVHVRTGGRLIVSGIISQRLVIESGGACYASGYIRTIPKVAEGGFLDVTGHLNPVRWPAVDIEGTILIAVGARYGQHVVTADGTFVPHESTTPALVTDSTPRFRIIRSGETPMLEGPAAPAQ